MSLKTIQVPRWNNWRSQEVEPWTVKAEAAGPFYIFRSVEAGLSGRWTLQHAKTGYGARKDLKSRASARRLARALSGLNWDFEMLPGESCQTAKWEQFPRRVRRDMRKAREIVLGWES